MSNEIIEKLKILQNQISNNKIDAKDMAAFCAVAYKKMGNNYDEELFVKINKRIMNFFNHGIMNILSPETLETADTAIKNCEKIKMEILNRIGIDNPNIEPVPYKDNIKLDEVTSKYTELKRAYSEIQQKKKPFLFRRKWKKGQLNFYAIVEGFEGAINEAVMAEKNKNERKELKVEKESIVEDVKKLLAGYNDDIGIKLAEWDFDFILSGEKKLQQYVGQGLLPELAGYIVNNKG